ncbi:MAG: ArsA family ATPase, partial [Desulfotignum sp.]|nr:ArsA family ATPase [Desulfotignum sp.]
LHRIQEIKSDYLQLKALFEDPAKTCFYVVYNQDVLSVAETGRVIAHLDRLAIQTRGLICNERIRADAVAPSLKNLPPGIPIQTIPFSNTSLIGMDALEQHILSHNLTFDKILQE